jgi:hypothetical protein
MNGGSISGQLTTGAVPCGAVLILTVSTLRANQRQLADGISKYLNTIRCNIQVIFRVNLSTISYLLFIIFSLLFIVCSGSMREASCGSCHYSSFA